jgi:acyl-CoA hydrolase
VTLLDVSVADHVATVTLNRPASRNASASFEDCEEIEATFRRPSRLGDRLAFMLEVTRVGGSSVGFHLEAHGEDGLRMEADLTLVWVSPEGTAAPWPDEVRARLQDEMNRKGQ